MLVFVAGCASAPVNSREILELIIKPDKGIKPGTIITVVVKTTNVIEKVTGSLDVVGSPKFPFRYDVKRKAWTFVYPVPITMKVPKGDFFVKIEATGKSGEIFTAEKIISTY